MLSKVVIDCVYGSLMGIKNPTGMGTEHFYPANGYGDGDGHGKAFAGRG